MAKIFTPWAPMEDDEEELAPALVTPQMHAAGQPLTFEAPETEDAMEEPENLEDEMESGPTPMMAQAMQVIAEQSALIQTLLAQVKSNG